jgi:hypothetical protein
MKTQELIAIVADETAPLIERWHAVRELERDFVQRLVDPLITSAEAARILGLSTKTLTDYGSDSAQRIMAGRTRRRYFWLKPVRIDGKVRWNRAEIEALSGTQARPARFNSTAKLTFF